MLSRRGITVAVGAAAILALLWYTRASGDRQRDLGAPAPAAAAANKDADKTAAAVAPKDDERTVSEQERLDALARAQVWHEPPVPVSKARLGQPANAPREVTCRFRVDGLGGTTSKFDCDVDGEKLRIKYGAGPELPAEAAATRLVHALGFGADEITLVPKLRCHGCPVEPFIIGKAIEVTHTKPLYERALDYDDYNDFEWVALERKLDARPIETDRLEGWAFFELERIDPARGGAPRAHVDALRLLAVFLAHWDNKSENQRLVCLSRDWPEGAPCREPFAMIQDLGATFGPRKVDLEAWERAAIFEDRARCVISMRDLPYDGATFNPVQIGEAGRQHLVRLLSQLTDAQLTDLFSGARFDQKRRLFADVRPIAEWIRVFKARVRAISEGPPCPS